MRYKNLFPLAFAALIFMFGCGTTAEKQVQINTQLKAEGPFFSGPNSVMANYQVNLNELLGDNIQPEAIKKVTINKIVVSLIPEDSIYLKAFNNATLQLVSNSVAMQTIAIKNPIETEGTALTLESSNEVDLSEYFKQNEFTILLDWDFIDDDYRENLGTNIEMELNFEIKN